MTKGIEKFIKKVTVQTAVYWSCPTNDGYGGFTFADPVEIPVRWEDRTEVITAGDGSQYVSKAKILVTQDVDEGGYLYLGSLSDLTEAQKTDPTRLPTAWKIRRFDKVPMIFKTDEFVRTAYI